MVTQLFNCLFPVLLAGHSTFIDTSFKNDVSILNHSSFTEGIVFTKTSFPNHPLNDTIKTLQFETGDFIEQYHVIQALKNYQQTTGAVTEQEIKDAFFVSAMTSLPLYSKMYFTPSRSLTNTDALGYRQQTFIDHADKTGKLVITDRNKDTRGTIHFSTDNTKEVWQKYGVDAEQYTTQKTTETSTVAGYTCTKVVYHFKGTTRGLPLANQVINIQPEKVTVWYTNDLPSGINIMHSLYFELDKAILKFEVEYDKKGKNKMLVEVTKVESKKIEDEWMEIEDVAPVVNYKNNKTEAQMMVMKVMMAAFSLLSN